jgi:pimeloyl-ACP methyl ester carboxylesterase
MRPMRLQTPVSVVVVLVAATAMSAPYCRSYSRAAAVFAGMVQLHGRAAGALEYERQAVTIEMATVPTRHGDLRTRLFVPARIRQAVTLMAGVNMLGIEEPRLYGLAYQLASVGVVVITPDTPDLKRFRISPRTTDMIEDSALWLSAQRRFAPSGRIGMVGISFSGGLSIIAAGRPRLRDRVDFVFSFGGHGDFSRELRFLYTGKEPTPAAPAATAGGEATAGEVYRRPHDYGVVIILLDLADRIVPGEQVGPLRDAILTYLLAGHYELIDKRLAKTTFDEAIRLTEALAEPSRTYMRLVNDRDVEKLGKLVGPVVESIGGDPVLSPERSAPPSCPVYLLHGTDDTVIPAIEARWMERYFKGKTPVRVLLSGLITHAELDRQQDVREVWKLVGFLAEILRQ